MFLKRFFRKRTNPLTEGMLYLPIEEIVRLLKKYPHEHKWRKLYFNKVNRMIEARNTCVLSAIISFLNLLVTLMSDNSQAKTIGMFVSLILVAISSVEIVKINKLSRHNIQNLSGKIKERIRRFDLEYLNSLIEKNKEIKDAIKHLEKLKNNSFIA